MQHLFASILWIVCGVGVLAAFAGLFFSRRTWEDYRKNALLLDSELPHGPAPGSAAAIAERDSEIRAMLEARNARRLRRGEEPLDVDQEFSRLTGVQIDSQLRAEIRDLVAARNYRRMRAGKPQLDVEAEVRREIEKLGSL